MRAKKGFTLVEILIVVVILGILAAIVIPQFTSASTEAKESALKSDLQAIRSQIELYKIHHNDNLPGTQATNDFETAMINKTNQDGQTASQATDPTTCIYGAYMQKLPINPFNDMSTVGTGATALPGTAAGDNTTGWYFVTSGADAGLFQANDDKQNPLTNEYHTNY
jgi:general secretion pathway protein G